MSKIPTPTPRARGIRAALVILVWMVSALEDGEISDEEWSDLLTNRVTPLIQEAVTPRAERWADHRIRVGVPPAEPVPWEGDITSSPKALQFRDWAANAMADGRITIPEVVQLFATAVHRRSPRRRRRGEPVAPTTADPAPASSDDAVA